MSDKCFCHKFVQVFLPFLDTPNPDNMRHALTQQSEQKIISGNKQEVKIIIAVEISSTFFSLFTKNLSYLIIYVLRLTSDLGASCNSRAQSADTTL